jgi:hypothetical protein
MEQIDLQPYFNARAVLDDAKVFYKEAADKFQSIKNEIALEMKAKNIRELDIDDETVLKLRVRMVPDTDLRLIDDRRFIGDRQPMKEIVEVGEMHVMRAA